MTPAFFEHPAANVLIAFAKEIKKYQRCRSSFGKSLHAGCSRMEAKLECFEFQAIIGGDNDFPIQHTLRWHLRTKRPKQLGKIAIQRFSIATLDEDLVPVAKDQRSKPIPLWLED